MARPWAKVEAPEPVNLQDIISEEMKLKKQSNSGVKVDQCNTSLEDEPESQLDSRKDVTNLLFDYQRPTTTSENEVEDDDYDDEMPVKKKNTPEKATKKESKMKVRVSTRRKWNLNDCDELTQGYLEKLIRKEIIKIYNGVFAIGNEAFIVHAESNEEYADPLPVECAVKIFKIKEESESQDDKQSARAISKIACEREMFNLMKLEKAQVPCPEIVCQQANVLVMSFIGEKYVPAPTLHKTFFTEVEGINIYKQVKDIMNKMFKRANLIHGAFSEHNILYWKGTCYIVDVGQAIDETHQQAFQMLYEDCGRIISFFNRRGVPVDTKDELFESISGFSYLNRLKWLHICD